jgi:hypothetical protein
MTFFQNKDAIYGASPLSRDARRMETVLKCFRETVPEEMVEEGTEALKSLNSEQLEAVFFLVQYSQEEREDLHSFCSGYYDVDIYPS